MPGRAPGPHIVNTSHNTLHLLVVLSGQRRSLHCHNVHDAKILIYDEVSGPRAKVEHQSIKKAILGYHNHENAHQNSVKDGWLRTAPEAEPVRRLTRGVLSFTSHKKSQTGENGEMEKRRNTIPLPSPAQDSSQLEQSRIDNAPRYYNPLFSRLQCSLDKNAIRHQTFEISDLLLLSLFSLNQITRKFE